MKIFQAIIIISAFLLAPLLAQNLEVSQGRLIQLQLDHANALASGLKKEDPKVQNLQAEIDALSRTPDIKNTRYRELLNQKKEMLDADLARLTSEGKGFTNAQVQKLNVEIAAVEKMQRN